MGIEARLSPSGVFLDNVALNATGTYQGTQAGPGAVDQKITLPFRPIVVQIIVQATAGPDTAFQFAKTKEMPDFASFFQSPGSAGFRPDLVRLDDDGFTVRNEANAAPAAVASDYFFLAQG